MFNFKPASAGIKPAVKTPIKSLNFLARKPLEFSGEKPGIFWLGNP